MPIYQYECEKYGHKFELLKEIGESDNETKCPQCEAEHPRKVLSTFNTCSPGRNCVPRGGG